jgi:hypothetical protein
MRAKVRIEITPHSNGTRVFINDQQIHDVRRLAVYAAPDELSTVVLTLSGFEVEIVGEAGDLES